MSCACFGGNGGGVVSCACGADDEGFGHARAADGEDVCCTSGAGGGAVGGVDGSFGGRDPSRDSLKLSSYSVKSKGGKNHLFVIISIPVRSVIYT